MFRQRISALESAVVNGALVFENLRPLTVH